MTKEGALEKFKSFNKKKFKIKYDIEILQILTELEKEKCINYTLSGEQKVIIEILEIKKIERKGLLKELEKKNGIDNLKRKFSVETVNKRYNIYEGVRSNFSIQKLEKIINMYKKNKTFLEISCATDVSINTIQTIVERWRKANGVPTRKEMGINTNGSIRKKQLENEK